MANNNFKIDFLGIGVHRAATSWIYQCLQEHPQICPASKKELHFLDDPKKCARGIEAYAAFFSHCKEDKIRGEYTPNYLASNEFNHDFVKKYFPHVKFIVCLRNPIERAYSHYLFHKTAEKVKEPFEEAIIKGAMRFYYIDVGFYYSQLKKFCEFYPKKNFLILIYEDIAENPIKFIQNIYQFLGIKTDFIPPTAKEKINWSAENTLRIPRLNLFITETKRIFYNHKKFSGPLVFFLKLFLIDKLIEIIRESNVRKDGLKPFSGEPISPRVRLYLQNIYQEEIKDLEKLINRNLSFWK